MNDKVHFVNTELPDILELKGICQHYPPDVKGKPPKVVIDDFDLLIEDKPGQGQFIVILGPSGCGKSTVLRHIAGLQKPTAGEILVNGQPRTREPISMVFQQYSSLPWFSVLENVELGLRLQGVSPKERREKALAMLDTVGLTGHGNKYAKYPLLSGGQLQRVAIARSLIANPKIVLMDEPFGALDAGTRFNMQMMVAKIWETMQSTFVFVTHDIPEAVFLADDIYVMGRNPGRIVTHFDIAAHLPFSRDFSVKKSPEFTRLVNEVEERILSL